jgi:hypothetical protein
MIDDVVRAFEELKKLSLERKDRAADRPNSAPDDVVFGIGDNKKWWEVASKDSKIQSFRWHDLRHTFCSRLAQAGVSLKVIQEEGAKAARERYDRVRHCPAVKQALERVQIDHTPVDLIVVDELKRRPFGRPWLSLAIDTASRMACGFFLSMIPPSSISVALALAHCVARKDLWLADRELSFDWPVSGLPDLVYMDNAACRRKNCVDQARAMDRVLQRRARPRAAFRSARSSSPGQDALLASSWSDRHGEDTHTEKVLALPHCYFRRGNRLHPLVRCSDPNAAPSK